MTWPTKKLGKVLRKLIPISLLGLIFSFVFVFGLFIFKEIFIYQDLDYIDSAIGAFMGAFFAFLFIRMSALANKKWVKLMDKKDKQLIKDSVDAVVSTIPGLNLAWGLSKALYGAGLKLRQQRALEWVEMVRDNPKIFTRGLLEQEEFQDGFVFALEKYLIERSEEKRKYLRNIFLGYAVVKQKLTFQLEKFIHTLSQMSPEDIKVLRDVDVSRKDGNYQIYGNEAIKITNIYNLISLGILFNDPSSRLGPVNAPFVWISEFGKEFIKYLKQ